MLQILDIPEGTLANAPDMARHVDMAQVMAATEQIFGYFLQVDGQRNRQEAVAIAKNPSADRRDAVGNDHVAKSGIRKGFIFQVCEALRQVDPAERKTVRECVIS